MGIAQPSCRKIIERTETAPVYCACIGKKYKNYRRGLNLAFYGVYYGILRLIVESFRSDSLYLWIRLNETEALYTGIKISQLVSWCAIIMGVVQYVLIFTKCDLKLDAWFAQKFKALSRFDAQIQKEQANYDKLNKIYQDLLTKFPADYVTVVQAKRKADYAYLAYRDKVNRKKDYIDDFKSRGIILEQPQETCD